MFPADLQRLNTATLDKAVGMQVNFYPAHLIRMGLGKTDWKSIRDKPADKAAPAPESQKKILANSEEIMRKHLVLWALGCGCAVLAFVSDGPPAQAKDTIIIAIPGTPQGVDLDRLKAGSVPTRGSQAG